MKKIIIAIIATVMGVGAFATEHMEVIPNQTKDIQEMVEVMDICDYSLISITVVDESCIIVYDDNEPEE